MPIEEVRKVDDETFGAWGAHDIDTFVSYCSDRLVWHDLSQPEPMRGKEDARRYMKSWFDAFPDLTAKQKNRVLSEDWVAAEVEFEGINTGPFVMGGNELPATNKHVKGKGAYFARIAGGELVEFHTYPDLAGMMAQLGLVQQ